MTEDDDLLNMPINEPIEEEVLEEEEENIDILNMRINGGYLTEMSYPCKKRDGFGMIIEIRSTDEHGSLGNEESPAHAHIYDTNKSKVGDIVITIERPAKPKEVIPYRCQLPDVYSKKICDWANASTSNPPQNNWDYLKNEWDRRRPD